MIAEITRALWAFWGQFEMDGEPIEAMQAGTVPDGSEFPYITFEAPRPDSMSTRALTAFGWFKNTNLAQSAAQRVAWWEAVEKAIPVQGVKLPLSVGFLMLRRGSGDFLYPGADEDDKTVLFGRVGYEATYYTK